MHALIVTFSLFLSLSASAQIAPITNGNVLTYDVFNAKQGFLKPEITFEPNKEQRVLKLSIENNGDRKYDFLNGRPFAIYDKSFTRTSNRGKLNNPNEYFELLPRNKKIEVGAQWEFSRTGSSTNDCGNWTATYQSKVIQGPETTILIDQKEVSVKTLLVEYSTKAKFTRDDCTTGNETRTYLYSPELNEIISDQAIDYMTGDTSLKGGYKWVLKSIITNANQVAK